jgi:hypothetical protein
MMDLSSCRWLQNVSLPVPNLRESGYQTFQMEQHIRLIILKHLRDQFYIHIMNIDFLYLSVLAKQTNCEP